VQTLLVATVTLLLATLGFLSPASRGALLTTAIVLFVLLAFAAGASAVALWGIMERTYEGWVGVALQVSVWLPGLIMLIFTVLNIALKHTGSLGAVPAGIYFSIVAIWFLVSVPLTFVGGFMATRLPILDFPVKTNQIPRQIPPAPIVAHPVLLFFSAGKCCLVFLHSMYPSRAAAAAACMWSKARRFSWRASPAGVSLLYLALPTADKALMYAVLLLLQVSCLLALCSLSSTSP
jgi:hypothetical protein